MPHRLSSIFLITSRRSKRMFDEHMAMLKEKMAKKAARQEQMRLEREAKRKVGVALNIKFSSLIRRLRLVAMVRSYTIEGRQDRTETIKTMSSVVSCLPISARGLSHLPWSIRKT